MKRIFNWRIWTLSIAFLFFFLPLLGGIRFSLIGLNGVGLSLRNYTWILHQPGFTQNLFITLRIAALTSILVVLLVVPTVIYLTLRHQRLIPLMEFFANLPIVVPVVSLAIGAQVAMPNFLASTSYELVFFYAVLSMPYVYRSLMIGLQNIPLAILNEASQTLGAGPLATLRLVIAPAISSAVSGALFITIAMCLGEYTLAILLHFKTFPTWITNVSQENILGSVALSVASLTGAWIVLLLVQFAPKLRLKK
jgi:putative spermidine/putrescine transport system permease protein